MTNMKRYQLQVAVTVMRRYQSAGSCRFRYKTAKRTSVPATIPPPRSRRSTPPALALPRIRASSPSNWNASQRTQMLTAARAGTHDDGCRQKQYFRCIPRNNDVGSVPTSGITEDMRGALRAVSRRHSPFAEKPMAILQWPKYPGQGVRIPRDSM